MISLNAFFLVLIAAFLHALWNSFVKGNKRKATVMILIVLLHFLFGVVLSLFSSFPSVEAWPFLIVSVFVHVLYFYFLFQSYNWGDLSEVYPLMRGIAPLLVTLGAFLFIGELPVGKGLIGIIFISLGIIILSVYGLFNAVTYKSLYFAILTGLCIASYSLLDGIGAREAKTALGYAGWLFILEGVFGLSMFWILSKKDFFSIDKKTLFIGSFGGLLSSIAYAIVIYVKVTSPLGLVSSLRETSVIFASLIGLIIFREKPWHLRIVAAISVTIGLIFISLSK